MSEGEEFQIGQTMEHIEAVLDRPLRRMGQQSGSGASHDFETADEAMPRIAFEHKQVAPSGMLKAYAAIQDFPGEKSSKLSLIWDFAIELSTLEVGLASNTSAVKMKGLAKRLEPHLLVLEQADIRDTGPYSPEEKVQRSQWEIRNLVGRCIGLGHAPSGDQSPGIYFHAQWGNTSALSANNVVNKVQSWFDDPEKSQNLIQSLSNADADERHAVLVLTADYGTLLNNTHLEDPCPASPLSVPEVVDDVWLYQKGTMANGLVLRYRNGEWRVASANLGL